MGPQLDACASVDVDRRNLPKTGMLSGRPVLFKLMCYSPRIAPGVKVPESAAIRFACPARQSDFRLTRPEPSAEHLCTLQPRVNSDRLVLAAATLARR